MHPTARPTRTGAAFIVVLALGMAAPAGAAPSTDCGTANGRGCKPAGQRVDLAAPTFSNPTRITNPLFPISGLESTVLLGHVDGKPFRTETTLLATGETMTVAGQRVETLVSQYVAFLDGRIEEVALDRYAQADDGSVWYLGEDVFDYRDGAIGVTEGTWLAERDGPAAMIMAPAPAVGQVYRPENAPGIVFEEVTVTKVDQTVAGPRGPVEGAIVVDELHVDGSHEEKIFAPGYGEFRTGGGSGGDLEAVALSVPTDALDVPVPAEIHALTTGSRAILESIRLRDWATATATLGRLVTASKALGATSLPPRIADRLGVALDSLRTAVRARKAAPAAQGALDLTQSALDLELRSRPQAEIDAERKRSESSGRPCHRHQPGVVSTYTDVSSCSLVASDSTATRSSDRTSPTSTCSGGSAHSTRVVPRRTRKRAEPLAPRGPSGS